MKTTPNPKPTLQDLEKQLRDGAQHRRSTLEQLAPAYPVGDYPPRSAEDRAQATGPGVVIRVLWLIGLGGLSTAALLGVVTLTQLVMPNPTAPSPGILAAEPRPDTLGPSVRSLLAGLGELETRMGQQIDPSVESAIAWPERLNEISVALINPDTGLQNPIEQEFNAFRADLQTAADHIREQCQANPKPAPTGYLPQPSAPSATG
ncbi:MAG: hypothetical protein AAGA25_13470 [Planctomycetota bacterium]